MSPIKDNIFHGSMRQIEGTLLPHKGRNPLGDQSFNQFGVYATPHFLSAIVYSLSIDRAKLFVKKQVFISYSPNQIRVKMKGCYWSRKEGYVYVVPSSNFTPLNEYEWISLSETPIIQTLTIAPEQIDKLIADKQIVLEQDPAPQNRLFQHFLHLEERLLKITSSFWHRYWQFINRKKCII